MKLELDFGSHFGYLAAAYVFVVAAIGGYLWSLVRREREVERIEAVNQEDEAAGPEAS